MIAVASLKASFMNFRSSRVFGLALGFVFGVGFCGAMMVGVFGQGLKREWVRQFSLDASKTNQATHIALAPDGNVVVAGSATGPSEDLDYVAVKYTPNGDEVWRARYDMFDDLLRGMTIDPAGNVVVTGSSDTVKFSRDGKFLWAQPVGGRAVIANAQYVYVTGFSDVDIATAQLENNHTDGREVWRRTVDGERHQTDVGQKLAFDTEGNVFVGGQLGMFTAQSRNCPGPDCDTRFIVLSYASDGTQKLFGFTRQYAGGLPTSKVEVKSIVFLPGFIVLAGTSGGMSTFIAGFDMNGAEKFTFNHYLVGGYGANKTIVDRNSGKLVFTGRSSYDEAFVGMADTAYNYQQIWKFPAAVSNDLLQNACGDFYVGGQKVNGFNSRTMFVAKVLTNGRQTSLDVMHPEAGDGRSIASSMVIDSVNSLFVVGTSWNTAGGTEFLTVKYVDEGPVGVREDGALVMQFFGAANQPYVLEGSESFVGWESVATNVANGEGMVEFVETNGAAGAHRFYRGRQE